MTSLICLLALLTSATLLAQEPPPAIQFESVPNPLTLPANLYLGEVAGVAVNSKGHIFIYTRSGHTQLHEFDPNGNYIRTIGTDLYGFVFAHTVRIDKDDNIWCVDEGSNMVIKFSPEGRVLMVLGRKPEAVEAAGHAETTPPARDGIFNRPTDIAWDAAGNSFISDGYNNSRVAKVGPEGNWITSWGKRGPGPGDFHTPHTIATDAHGHVYVGDRENRRIQIFDGDGKFLNEWTNIGAPWAICMTPPSGASGEQFLYSSDSVPGRIYKLDLKGNILGVFGEAGKRPGQFGWVHEMACPSENVLYVGEILNWRMQKLVLHP